MQDFLNSIEFMYDEELESIDLTEEYYTQMGEDATQQDIENLITDIEKLGYEVKRLNSPTTIVTILKVENVPTLENVLKVFLGLETREDYRESNKGNIIELNMNDRCDLAYIRNRFRRHLKSQQPKQLKLFTDWNNGYVIIDENSNIDLNTLEGLNKVINRINLALTEIEANNEKVFGLYDRL